MKRCFEEWEEGKRENYSTKLNIKLYVRNSIKTLISSRNSHILISKGTMLILIQDLVTEELVGYGTSKGQQVNISEGYVQDK